MFLCSKKRSQIVLASGVVNSSTRQLTGGAPGAEVVEVPQPVVQRRGQAAGQVAALSGVQAQRVPVRRGQVCALHQGQAQRAVN